jgi:acyl-CoA thioesterase-1
VAGSDTLNQRDGIHPTAEGARILADNVWAVLKPLAETKRQTGS